MSAETTLPLIDLERAMQCPHKFDGLAGVRLAIYYPKK